MSTCYIDRNQSETIKGILILLIVFGHNHVLCPNTEIGGMMDYLYLFHIAGFFILPFFYKTNKTISIEHIKSLVVRNYVPYFLICLICWLCFSIVSKNFHFGLDVVLSIFMGTQTHLSSAVGFVFPWFLPTYCSFSIILACVRNNNWKMILLTLFSIWIWTWDWGTFYVFKSSIPLGLGLAVSYFGLGYLTFYIHKFWNKSYLVAIPCFLFMSIAYWKDLSFSFLYKLFPVFFFLCILELSRHVDFKFVRILGRNSLGIYLFHMFFVNIVYRVFPHNIMWGILGFIISLLFPLFLTFFIYRVEFFRIVFFPMDINELKYLLKKKKSW